ncbi:MAG TPA: EscU/YscU/HrcU family type III secretion system export apparatus switch protein, partial [Bacillota bacterium]|nr:EscU/YscU/HrcU family type III secretion system export apparatus switch protein [Bacillota bacterium]
MRVRINLQFFAGEKTEPATPKKRRDVRKKGQVFKSQDL